jgi:hypothetical protein
VLSVGWTLLERAIPALDIRQGRSLDYSIPVDMTPGVTKELRKSIENTLLCTQFTPATMFGLPKAGKLRITLRRNQVDVAG